MLKNKKKVQAVQAEQQQPEQKKVTVNDAIVFGLKIILNHTKMLASRTHKLNAINQEDYTNAQKYKELEAHFRNQTPTIEQLENAIKVIEEAND